MASRPEAHDIHNTADTEMPIVFLFLFTIQKTVVALTTQNVDEYSPHMTSSWSNSLKCKQNADGYPASCCPRLMMLRNSVLSNEYCLHFGSTVH